MTSFAQRGRPRADSQCVRTCPTGVLTFGQVDRTGRVARTDRFPAGAAKLAEG